MKKQDKYLEDKLELIKATITGSFMGLYLFQHLEEGMEIGERIQKHTDLVMENISKDIENIYKYN